ncbi:MAG TPA: type II toxin-antitoxin system RelE/ParE family toxin [Pyrinomonadaceae bacterium]|jgi:toxin ParE1/3/4
MKLRISEPAKEDLIEIYQHIALKNAPAAERLLKTFQEKFELLTKFPNIGRDRNELVIGLRSFPVGKYLILYQPTDEAVEIVRVRHGATDLDELFDI